MIQVFDPDGKEVVFHGALDPHTPIAQGWLRASHRKLDPKLSRPYRPYHTHDEIWPLKPGEIVELDVEIWPTCIVIPAGYRIGLSVRGKDYSYKGASGGRLSNMKNEFTGCGPFLHDDPQDRPAAIYRRQDHDSFRAPAAPTSCSCRSSRRSADRFARRRPRDAIWVPMTVFRRITAKDFAAAVG